jgi:hypothetical protein
MSGEMGNMVVKVNVNESVEELPMMGSTKLLEAWVSSDKADSISDKANGVIQVASGNSIELYFFALLVLSFLSFFSFFSS